MTNFLDFDDVLDEDNFELRDYPPKVTFTGYRDEKVNRKILECPRLFNSYFKDKIVTDLEKNKSVEIKKLIKEFVKKIYNEDIEREFIVTDYWWNFLPEKGLNNIDVGFLDDFGYYALISDQVSVNFCTKNFNDDLVNIYNDDYSGDNIFVYNLGVDLNIAFQKIVTKFLFSNYKDSYEEEQNFKLNQEYIERFGQNLYFGYLNRVEQVYEIWNKYYDGNIPLEIINYFISYLDCYYKHDNITWYYDAKSRDFKFIERGPEVISIKKEKTKRKIFNFRKSH